MHELVRTCFALPLGVRRAMYLEGGPEASLSLATSGKSFVRVGSWETGFNENDDNHLLGLAQCHRHTARKGRQH